ncbi:FG-GAP-like repeat-containing protein [Nannocystis radixulma]|uniref:FG-GAP-like repeat-containing protein n=1 Tax=Nannocystis radixulma TaxID=2995305 RepID=A0ABT5BN12_9BACT|nr:FG-GAP-like repeat-containing protein [Nannocystis radixulma]MDC0674894.1 FG-GAP-like repeat-containing protein [Nannocystis radixulma]
MVDCRIAGLLAFVAGMSACAVPNPLFSLGAGDDTSDGVGTDPATASSGPDETGLDTDASTGPGTTTIEPGTTTDVAPVCGNGQHEAGEQCDDGNLIPGDDCEVNCRQLFRPFDKPVDATADATALALGDLDNDGDDDLALGYATCSIGQACVRSWLNDGDAGFVEAEPLPVAEAPARLFIGHWDDDDVIDVLATHAGGYITLTLRGSIEGPIELQVPGDLPAAVVARLDGDEMLDLVVPNEQGNTIHYALANGFGFSPPNVVSTMLPPHSVAVVDVDGDGELDILYTTYSGPTTGFSVKLGFEGPDIGPFTSNASNAGAIAFGDFGAPRTGPNVVYSDPVGNTLQVFDNKGSGQFEKTSDTIDAEPGMLRLLGARINTDGVDNIVALAPAALQLFTYVDGKIAAGPSRNFAGTGIDVQAGRLGGDARLDLAVLTTQGAYTLINQSGE